MTNNDKLHQQRAMAYLRTLDKIETDDQVPMMPRNADHTFFELMYAKGMIRKDDLKDGVTYYGGCRNAVESVWHKDKDVFTYRRTKWGSTFDEDIKYPTDDDCFDVFVPLREVRDGEA